jgi:hypothetical protein
MPAQLSGNSTIASVAPVKLRAGVATVVPKVGLTSTYPVTDIAYILLAASAYLDTTGKFKFTADIVSVTDSIVVSLGKIISDSLSVADSGTLVSQGYCDLTYFAEDYVGTYITF